MVVQPGSITSSTNGRLTENGKDTQVNWLIFDHTTHINNTRRQHVIADLIKNINTCTTHLFYSTILELIYACQISKGSSHFIRPYHQDISVISASLHNLLFMNIPHVRTNVFLKLIRININVDRTSCRTLHHNGLNPLHLKHGFLPRLKVSFILRELQLIWFPDGY